MAPGRFLLHPTGCVPAALPLNSNHVSPTTPHDPHPVAVHRAPRSPVSGLSVALVSAFRLPDGELTILRSDRADRSPCAVPPGVLVAAILRESAGYCVADDSAAPLPARLHPDQNSTPYQVVCKDREERNKQREQVSSLSSQAQIERKKGVAQKRVIE